MIRPRLLPSFWTMLTPSPERSSASAAGDPSPPAAAASHASGTAAPCRVRLGGALLALLAMLCSPTHSSLNAEHMLTIHPDFSWQVQVAQAPTQLRAHEEELAFRRLFSWYGHVDEGWFLKTSGARYKLDYARQAASAQHDPHRPLVRHAACAAAFRCWDNATPCWVPCSQYGAHVLQDPRHAVQWRKRASLGAAAAHHRIGLASLRLMDIL